MREPAGTRTKEEFIMAKLIFAVLMLLATTSNGLADATIGVNVGHAVLSADGKHFKTNEENGFTKLWNKECANKSGTEAATAIRWFAL
jgi:hypothetical protein